MDERTTLGKDISRTVLAVNTSKVNDARGLGLAAHMVVEKMRTFLELATCDHRRIDDRKVLESEYE